MRIIGYCDYQGNTLEQQIAVAEELNIEGLFIKKINGLKISEFDNELIKDINRQMKQKKLEIALLDPLVPSYDLYDIEKFDKTIEEYTKVFEVSNKLKVNQVVYRLPKITNILDEFEALKKQLDVLIDLSKRAKITLMIYQEEEKTNVLAYILKKYRKRDLQLIFNPSQTIINKESPIVAYRLLKDSFDYIVIADIDKRENPELIGYGRVNLIDLFKRMNRDNYLGYFILDPKFGKFIRNDKEEEKKVPWYKKLLTRKDESDSYMRGYSLRIFPNEEPRDVTVSEIYINQINVLKIAFRIKG